MISTLAHLPSPGVPPEMSQYYTLDELVRLAEAGGYEGAAEKLQGRDACGRGSRHRGDQILFQVKEPNNPFVPRGTTVEIVNKGQNGLHII